MLLQNTKPVQTWGAESRTSISKLTLHLGCTFRDRGSRWIIRPIRSDLHYSSSPTPSYFVTKMLFCLPLFSSLQLFRRSVPQKNFVHTFTTTGSFSNAPGNDDIILSLADHTVSEVFIRMGWYGPRRSPSPAGANWGKIRNQLVKYSPKVSLNDGLRQATTHPSTTNTNYGDTTTGAHLGLVGSTSLIGSNRAAKTCRDHVWVY